MPRFNYSGLADFASDVIYHPGKPYDRTDNEGHSAVPVGGPAPYGRVLVAAPDALTGGQNKLGERHPTGADAVCLPDVNGTALIDSATNGTFAAAGLNLPVGADGELIVRGIGIWTEWRAPVQAKLAQPFGLGETYYQAAGCGEVGLCQEGNIVCYTETDINIGDALFYRTVVDNTTDGIQLLGSFSNVNSANHSPFTGGRAFIGGKAGGAFVLSMNMR